MPAYSPASPVETSPVVPYQQHRMLQRTATASGAITGGDPLEYVSGSDDTVRRVTAANTRAAAGIAAGDAANGQPVTYWKLGALEFAGPADGTIAVGDQVQLSSIAARQVKAVAAGATADVARSIVGTAVTGGADAATVRWVSG
jgi:hypothetical protein